MPGKPTAPMIELELDKKRRLLLNFNAMALFEEQTGKNILASDVMENPSARDIRALLWACLVHEDPELTVEQVGAMIHMGNIRDISQAIAAAWKKALPKARGGQVRPLPQANHSTG